MPAKNVITKSVSIDPEILETGLQRAKELGFRHSFSAYVTHLIEKDQSRLFDPTSARNIDAPGSDAGGADPVTDPRTSGTPTKYPKPPRRKSA